MAWRVIDGGIVPSIPLGHVKAVLRVHHNADDHMLRRLIQMARQHIELFTQSVLGDVRLEITLDRGERSKHPWSGLSCDPQTSASWVTLPVGPLHSLESISVRNGVGEWQNLSLHHFIVEGCRLVARGDIAAIINSQHSLRIVGRGGIHPVPPIIEGVWISLIGLLYESDTPDVRLLRGALAPLKFLRRYSLV